MSANPSRSCAAWNKEPPTIFTPTHLKYDPADLPNGTSAPPQTGLDITSVSTSEATPQTSPTVYETVLHEQNGDVEADPIMNVSYMEQARRSLSQCSLKSNASASSLAMASGSAAGSAISIAAQVPPLLPNGWFACASGPGKTSAVTSHSATPEPAVDHANAFENTGKQPDYLKMILTAKVYDVARITPLQFAPGLCAKLGRDNFMLLKREDLQPVFSFKCRGAYNRMAHLTEEEKRRGVIACSAGTVQRDVTYTVHYNLAESGAGWSYTWLIIAVVRRQSRTGRRSRCPEDGNEGGYCYADGYTRYQVPQRSAVGWGSRAVRRRLRRSENGVRQIGKGVWLRQVGEGDPDLPFIGALLRPTLTLLPACTAVSFEGSIPPFDDPYVIAGAGTVGLEILRQTDLEKITAIFCAVGGGGLISGIAAYVKRIRPAIRIFGVETHDSACMTEALRKGSRVHLQDVGLFADGAAVKLAGEETFRICRDHVDGMVNVNNDELCAAIKDIFEDTRTVVEPAGALAVAGCKKYLAENKDLSGGVYVCVTSGANINFDRLRFVAERAELGEKREVLISVIIPERPGSFFQLYSVIYPRNVTEFSYRYGDPDRAYVYMSFIVLDPANRHNEVAGIFEQLRSKGMDATDLSDNEMAKSHARYMIGGRSKPEHERVLRFVFPERPGALKKFLDGVESIWNITMWHYRNYGSDMAKVLVGMQVPPQDASAFASFLKQLKYPYTDESKNPVYAGFLRS